MAETTDEDFRDKAEKLAREITIAHGKDPNESVTLTYEEVVGYEPIRTRVKKVNVPRWHLSFNEACLLLKVKD